MIGKHHICWLKKDYCTIFTEYYKVQNDIQNAQGWSLPPLLIDLFIDWWYWINSLWLTKSSSFFKKKKKNGTHSLFLTQFQKSWCILDCQNQYFLKAPWSLHPSSRKLNTAVTFPLQRRPGSIFYGCQKVMKSAFPLGKLEDTSYNCKPLMKCIESALFNVCESSWNLEKFPSLC